MYISDVHFHTSSIFDDYIQMKLNLSKEDYYFTDPHIFNSDENLKEALIKTCFSGLKLDKQKEILLNLEKIVFTNV